MTTLQEEQWKDNFTDSDGDVGSLLDSAVDEEDDSSLAAVSGDEGEQFHQYFDLTGRQQGRNESDHPSATRHRVRGEVAHKAGTPPMFPPLPQPSKPPIVSHRDGLTFDVSQAWQRSLLKQYDMQKSHPPARRKRPELMYVIHTESRDHGFSWDEGSAFSMDTSNGSAMPIHSQFVHRLHHPSLNGSEPPRPVDGVSSLSETTAKEDRDDATSRPVYPSVSPTTPPPKIVETNLEQSPRSVMQQHPSKLRTASRKQRMHDTMKPYMHVGEPVTANMAPPDPACYCLGYNMLDVLLPPHERRMSRPLSRVEEEVLFHHQQKGL